MKETILQKRPIFLRSLRILCATWLTRTHSLTHARYQRSISEGVRSCESCRTQEWVMSHIWISHVMSHIWMSHVTHGWVMSNRQGFNHLCTDARSVWQQPPFHKRPEAMYRLPSFQRHLRPANRLPVVPRWRVSGVCCSVVQRGATWCNVVQCCAAVKCGAVWCSVVQCGVVWCNVVQCVVQCGVVRCRVV